MKAQMLQKRSQMLQSLRAFFYDRNLIEVDTPMLSQGATTDLHLQSLQTQVRLPGESEPKTYYWHTSPEYPMKRLLSEGVGDMFYLGKVFRDGDWSPRHQIEFTMLEWYRLGFSLQDLIDEVVILLQESLWNSATQIEQLEQLTYQQLFAKYAQIDNIFTASAAKCRDVLRNHGVAEIVGVDSEDKVLWEQLVLTEVIESQLGKRGICVVTDFPARDAALAKINSNNPLVAQRFEVFINGMELANGYHELADANEYRLRFSESNQQRKAYDLPEMPLDENLLQSIAESGFPDCSGVALGVDRLFALQQGFENIEQGIAFGIHQA